VQRGGNSGDTIHISKLRIAQLVVEARRNGHRTETIQSLKMDFAPVGE
jgi:hypothetical protein